jgi:hypothetical protein
MQFHFIMTVQVPIGNNGFQTGTFSGAYTLLPGQTRTDVFNDLFDMFMRKMGCHERPNVLFFSLEPNELSAA